MNIKISIGSKPDVTVFIIGSVSYVHVGKVAMLKFFKWVPYEKVGDIYRVFGFTCNSTKKAVDG